MTKQEIKRQDKQKTGCGSITLVEHSDGSYRFVLAKNGTCAYAISQTIRSLINEMTPEQLIKARKKLIGTECHRSNCCIAIIGEFINGTEND